MCKIHCFEGYDSEGHRNCVCTQPKKDQKETRYSGVGIRDLGVHRC